MSDDLNRAADDFKDAVEGVGKEVGKAAGDVAGSVSEAADKGAAMASEASHTAADAARNAADTARGAASDAADTARNAAGDAAEAASKAAREAADNAAKAAGSATDAARDAGKAAKSTMDDIVEGVERVSTTVAGSARQAWESDQRKEVQDSVVKGLGELATAIEEQTKKFAANPETQKVVARIEEVTERAVAQVRSSKTIQDLAEGLAKGLSALATSIEGWLNQKTKTDVAASDDVASIEVSRLEPPGIPSQGPVSWDDDTQSIEIDKP